MKKNNKYSSGITIISLVITIILLLILASISLQAITNTGLFESANKAKIETKRAQVEEWLNLKLMEEQAGKPTGKAEEIIDLTRQNVLKNQEELETVGKTVSIEDLETESVGNKVDIYFYVQVDKDVYRVDAKSAKFLGEVGKIPPSISIESITETSNSITVTVATKRNEGGVIEYYIKADDEEKYNLKGTTADTSFTFSGLEQKKKYNIKVVAIASNNQTAEAKIDKIIGSVPDLQEGDVTFTYKVDGQVIDKETWTNKNVTVTASTKIAGYTLQTSKDNITWHDVKNQIFTDNGKIYARLWDGTNAGKTISANVTNIDTVVPKDFTPTATSTTKSITVTAVAEDADATSTSGKSGIAGYRFKLDGGEWTGYQTSGTYTWDNLMQSTSHTITVETKDNAGNSKQGTVTIGTETVSGLTISNASFKYEPSGWTSGSVKATASTTVSGFTIQTSKDGSTWNSTSEQTFTENGTIHARLWDGTNAGASLTANVTNIDTTAPTISTALSPTSQAIDSITLSVGITDVNSGIGKIEWYYGTTEEPTTLVETTNVTELNGSTAGPTTAQTETCTISGLTQSTTYYFKVIVYDVAGNKVTSSVISASTINPTAENVSYTPADTTWNVENVKQALDSLYSR